MCCSIAQIFCTCFCEWLLVHSPQYAKAGQFSHFITTLHLTKDIPTLSLSSQSSDTLLKIVYVKPGILNMLVNVCLMLYVTVLVFIMFCQKISKLKALSVAVWMVELHPEDNHRLVLLVIRTKMYILLFFVCEMFAGLIQSCSETCSFVLCVYSGNKEKDSYKCHLLVIVILVASIFNCMDPVCNLCLINIYNDKICQVCTYASALLM